MLFREHRGSLDESMRTVVEIKSRADLTHHLTSVHLESFPVGTKFYSAMFTDLKFEYQGYDERIKWMTWIVTLDGYCVLGMMNGTFEGKDEDFRKGIEELNKIASMGREALTDEAKEKSDEFLKKYIVADHRRSALIDKTYRPKCNRKHLDDSTKAELEYQLLVNNLAPPVLYSDRTARAELRYFMLFVLVVFAGVMLFS